MNKDIIYSNFAPEPVGDYPHARIVGDFIYLSGIGPRIFGKKEIPGVVLDENKSILSYDFEKQCHSVFKNVKTVLLDTGLDWNDLIDVTVFLTNMKDDFKVYNRIYKDYFKDNHPCRTTLGINSLPTPIAIELKCIAYKKRIK